MLKEKLKEWRLTQRNNWKQKKEEIINQLSKLEKIQELRILVEEKMVEKIHLSIQFEEVVNQEEITWRRRSRV